MTTDSTMKIVTALIRPHMEGRVVNALHELTEFPGFFIVEARGQGKGRGVGGAYKASEFDLTYHRYIQLEIVCRSVLCGEICEKIAAAAWTGRKGDGVIFTSNAHSFVRIREMGRPNEVSQ